MAPMDLSRIVPRHVIVDESPLHGGSRVLVRFGNGYGGSVVSHPYSYGGPAGLFEVGVAEFEGEGPEWHLAYDTPVTDDVIGYLTWDEVVETLHAIADLPPAKGELHA